MNTSSIQEQANLIILVTTFTTNLFSPSGKQNSSIHFSFLFVVVVDMMVKEVECSSERQSQLVCYHSYDLSLLILLSCLQVFIVVSLHLLGFDGGYGDVGNYRHIPTSEIGMMN